MKNPQIYINSELEYVTLTEAFDMVQESTHWDDFDTNFYEKILEALDLEFNFHPTEEDPDVDWEIFWYNEVVPAVEKIKEELAEDLLEEIKKDEVSYAIVSGNREVYCNADTQNIMDIYGYNDSYTGEHFYGVYGDAVDGQLDSRSVSDEVILKGIKLMLKLGSPVKRDELPKGEDFKPTFLEV